MPAECSWNKIHDPGAENIAGALESLTCLKELHLWYVLMVGSGRSRLMNREKLSYIIHASYGDSACKIVILRHYRVHSI